MQGKQDVHGMHVVNIEGKERVFTLLDIKIGTNMGKTAHS